jgi:VanZ family protein
LIKIAPDKWKHFFVGIAMGLSMQWLLFFLFPLHKIIASVAVLAIVIIIGYGFELFSKFTGKGHYDVMDAVATVIGGLIGMSIIGLAM